MDDYIRKLREFLTPTGVKFYSQRGFSEIEWNKRTFAFRKHGMFASKKTPPKFYNMYSRTSYSDIVRQLRRPSTFAGGSPEQTALDPTRSLIRRLTGRNPSELEIRIIKRELALLQGRIRVVELQSISRVARIVSSPKSTLIEGRGVEVPPPSPLRTTRPFGQALARTGVIPISTGFEAPSRGLTTPRRFQGTIRQPNRIASAAGKIGTGLRGFGGGLLSQGIFFTPLFATPAPKVFTIEYKEYVEDSINNRLNEIAQRVIQRAQQLTPKITGNLSRSYGFNVVGTTLDLFNTSSYFPYVEARVHMLEQARNDFEEEILQAVISDATGR